MQSFVASNRSAHTFWIFIALNQNWPLSWMVDSMGGSKGMIYDKQRDQYLKQEGVTVLRFWNNQLIHEFEGVIEMIYTTLKGRTPHPNPLPQGERGRGSQKNPRLT